MMDYITPALSGERRSVAERGPYVVQECKPFRYYKTADTPPLYVIWNKDTRTEESEPYTDFEQAVSKAEELYAGLQRNEFQFNEEPGDFFYALEKE